MAAKQPRKTDRPSSIDRLEPALKDEIARLRFGHGYHLDEILAHLNTMGAPEVSRTALGRHVKLLKAEIDDKVEAELAKISPAMQFATQMGNALVSKIDGASNDVKLRATRELLQSLLFQMALGGLNADPADPESGLSIKDTFHMARALQTLAQAEKTEDTRQREAAQQAKLETMAAVEEVAKKSGGLTAETVDEIRRLVLGDA